MAEITERRCPACKTWNQGELSHCLHCGTLIDPVKVLAESERQREAKKQERPKAMLERFLESIEQSSNPFVKVLYHVFSFFWFIYMSILAFFMWLIALGPG